MNNVSTDSKNRFFNDTKVCRRGLIKRTGSGILAALAAAILAPANARAELSPPRAVPQNNPSLSPLVGSWLLQVTFTAGPNIGKTEETLACFQIDGVMVESDGRSPFAHFGNWSRDKDNQYSYTLVELMYDQATGNVSQIVVPQINVVMDSSNVLHSISATTNIYIYNPATGGLLNKISIPNVSQVIGQRLTPGWVPPPQFPVSL